MPFDLLTTLKSICTTVLNGKDSGFIYQKYLFVAKGQQASDDWIRDGFHQICVSQLNLNMGVKSYRQLSHGLMTQFMKVYQPILQYELQAGHSSLTAQKNYGVSNAQVNGLSLQEARLMSVDWQHFLGLSMDVNLAPAATPSCSGSPFVTQSIDVERPLIMTPSPSPLQPAKTQIIAPLRNSVEFGSNWVAPEPVSDYSQGISSSSYCIAYSKGELDVLMNGLESIYGAGARFKSSEQVQACHIALESSRDAIIKLPTGGGKSLTFLLASQVEKSFVTVVVVPTTSLLNSHSASCAQLKIHCLVWNQSLTVAGSLGKVVFVHVQEASKDDFKGFLASLAMDGALKRLVFDEAHLLVSWKGFHEKIRFLETLRVQSKAQCLFLSATLTKAILYQIIESFSLVEPYLVSGSTDRPNLSYGIKTAADCQSLPSLLFESIKFENVLAKGRGIVYVLSKAEVVNLTSFLGQAGLSVAGFSSDTPALQKASIYQDWIKGTFKWIVATTAFGVGVDYPHVRAVIVYGGTFCGLDLIQMFGRAGRDGTVSKCLLLTSEDYRLPDSQPGVHELRAFATATGCLRQVLLSFVEEAAAPCILLKTLVPCQPCLEGLGKKRVAESQDGPPSKTACHELESSALATQEKLLGNLSIQLQVKAKLQQYQEHCLLCQVVLNQISSKHDSIYQCPCIKGRCIRCLSKDCVSQTVVSVRRAACPTNRVNLSAYKVCYYCGLPLYAKYHPKDLTKNDRQSCSSSGCDSLRALAHLLFVTPRWRRVLEGNLKDFPFEPTPELFFTWLHQSVEQGVNNLCLVFLFWAKNQALFVV